MAKRKARKLALKQVKMNLSTDSKVTAKSGLKTRYELNKNIKKIN
jgi:hypothetical protein